jgi:hypothetical protein
VAAVKPTELDSQLSSFLWDHDKPTFILHTLSIYNELSGDYSMSIIIQVTAYFLPM